MTIKLLKRNQGAVDLGARSVRPNGRREAKADMFELDQLYHPRTSEWNPIQKVSDYVAKKI